MRIYLISVGNKMPDWVQSGYQEYAKRLPRECELILKEIPAGKRLKNSNVQRLISWESEKILEAIPKDCYKIALDLSGKTWSTEDLSQQLQQWRDSGRNIALFIGGPEGLNDAVRQAADQCWCLSRLTFPHPLVRVIVAEQIYRAWTLLNNHPYHR